jgi:hypothetical protein
VQATVQKAAGFDPRSHTDAQVIWQLVLPEGNPALVPFQPNPAVLRDLNVGCGLCLFSYSYNVRVRDFARRRPGVCVPHARVPAPQTHGVTRIVPDVKKGSVDVKLKELVASFVREHELDSDVQRASTLVVLLAGDRDFAPELRSLHYARWPLVLLHSNASEALRRVARRECGEWKTLIERWSTGSTDCVMRAPPCGAPSSASSASSVSSECATVVSSSGDQVSWRFATSETVFVAQFLYLRQFLASELRALFAPDGLRVEFVDKAPGSSDGPSVHFFAGPTALLPSQDAVQRKLRAFLHDRIEVSADELCVVGVSKQEVCRNTVLKAAQVAQRALLLVSRCAAPASAVTSLRVGVDVPVTWAPADVNAFVTARYHVLGIALHADATTVDGVRDPRHIFKGATLHLNLLAMTAPQLRNVVLAMRSDSAREPRVVFPSLAGREHAGCVFAQFYVQPADFTGATQIVHSAAMDASCLRMTVPAAWSYRVVRHFLNTLPWMRGVPVHHIDVRESGAFNIADVMLNTQTLKSFEKLASIALTAFRQEPVLLSPDDVAAVSGSRGVRRRVDGICDWVAFSWRRRGGKDPEPGAHNTRVQASTMGAPTADVRLRVQVVHDKDCSTAAEAILRVVHEEYGSNVAV